MDYWPIVISVIALSVSIYTRFSVWWRDKVKIKVEFKKSDPHFYTFEVKNLGRMDIDISNAEMSIHRSEKREKLGFRSAHRLPYRLESLSSFKLFFDTVPTESVEDLEFKGKGKGYIFVYTPARKRPYRSAFDLNT